MAIMEVALFYSIVILAMYFVGRGFLNRELGYVALPSMFALIVLLWVVPQLSLIRTMLPHLDQPLSTIYLMTILAILGTAAGWSQGKAHGWRGHFSVPGRRLLFATALVLTTISGLTTLLIHDLGEGIGGMQTGIVTILLFFQNIKVVSLFLSLYLALRYRSAASLALVTINFLIYFPLILLYFRRRAMVELALCTVLSLWFARRIMVPRIVILAGLPAAFLIMFAVGTLRSLALGDGDWSYLSLADLRTVDFLATNPLKDAGKAPEMLNAVYLAQLADSNGMHTLGANTWNRFIFQWVPAQIVGADTKMSLMFDDTSASQLYSQFKYSIPTGSTRTGIADAYLEFWYFGALFFTGTAYLMGRLWTRAQRGDPWAMVFFVAGITPALISITHYAFYFYNMMLLFLIMIWVIRGGLSMFKNGGSNLLHSGSARPMGKHVREAMHGALR